MSNARLVITAVVAGGRSQGEVARQYGVSRGWISRLVARYRAGGEAASEPRSRRPDTSPGAIPGDTAGLIIGLRKELAGQGLDAGPHAIAWHLQHHHQVTVSPAAISRYLSRAGLVTPERELREASIRNALLLAASVMRAPSWPAGYSRPSSRQAEAETSIMSPGADHGLGIGLPVGTSEPKPWA